MGSFFSPKEGWKSHEETIKCIRLAAGREVAGMNSEVFSILWTVNVLPGWGRATSLGNAPVGTSLDGAAARAALLLSHHAVGDRRLVSPSPRSGQKLGKAPIEVGIFAQLAVTKVAKNWGKFLLRWESLHSHESQAAMMGRDWCPILPKEDKNWENLPLKWESSCSHHSKNQTRTEKSSH